MDRWMRKVAGFVVDKEDDDDQCFDNHDSFGRFALDEILACIG